MRGIANSGPIVSMIATPRMSEKWRETRAERCANPPARATTITPRIGRPTAEMVKPTSAGTAAWPLNAPTSGGKMRLPAPKNIEKNVTATTNRCLPVSWVRSHSGA